MLALCFSFYWHHSANFSTETKDNFYILTLADGLDCTSVERNTLLFKGFWEKNKESVAELFVSLISKVSNYKVHLPNVCG